MVITVDGPAGAGKSTVARNLAERLGFDFLDTGAMYRAIALAALEQHIDWQDSRRLEQLARETTMELRGNQVFLNGRDVSDAIRSSSVASVIYHVADHPGVRARLVELQRQHAIGRDIVTEGRDQGTVAFPDAICKIFLNASPHERAKRRLVDLQARGESLDLETVLSQQNDRDYRDSTRPVGRLVRASDAIEIVTDGMSVDEVVNRLEGLVREVISHPS